jgi:phenylacetate-CoA ligase
MCFKPIWKRDDLPGWSKLPWVKLRPKYALRLGNLMMNSWIVRELFLPFHEAVMRRPTFEMAERLEQSQWLELHQLRLLQLRKLQRLLAHAWRNCPFYRERLDDAGLRPDEVHSLEAFSRLPLLSRDEVIRHRDAMVWRNVPGGLIRSNTGGSTGRPLVFYVDRRRQAAFKAARIRAHRWSGVQPGDHELYIWGAPAELDRQDRLKAVRDRVTNEVLLNAFHMSPERMDDYLERIETFRPSCIFGYPSSLALLCEHACRKGREIRTPRLKAVMVTGELLYEHQRAAIEDYFRVPVANGYGSRDGGFIAHECPEGSMHTTDEYAIVELVDRDGRAVGPGAVGEIVVTDLEAFGMPLIRYRTGDLARRPLVDAQWCCPCGRALGVIEVNQGRQTDLLIMPDGTIKHALSLIYVVRDIDSIGQFKIVQQRDLSVDVSVVADAGGRLSPRDRQRILQGLSSHLGESVECRLREVAAIDPESSGKHRYVVSHAAGENRP